MAGNGAETVNPFRAFLVPVISLENKELLAPRSESAKGEIGRVCAGWRQEGRLSPNIRPWA